MKLFHFKTLIRKVCCRRFRVIFHTLYHEICRYVSISAGFAEGWPLKHIVEAGPSCGVQARCLSSSSIVNIYCSCVNIHSVGLAVNSPFSSVLVEFTSGSFSRHCSWALTPFSVVDGLDLLFIKKSRRCLFLHVLTFDYLFRVLDNLGVSFCSSCYLYFFNRITSLISPFIA